MIILDVEDLKLLVKRMGIKQILLKHIEYLKQDFAKWQSFEKCPRHATHYPEGVIELMPAADAQYYAFKYVNGHPNNPLLNKPTVMATGQLSDAVTGEPLLYTEMTLMTAIRTASTSAFAGQYLLRNNAKTMAVIGTGSQSEYQTLAFHYGCGIETVRYYDRNADTMKKYADNLAGFGIKLIPCRDAADAINGADCITTITAAKRKQKVLLKSQIVPGVFINAVGGDSPGKTELDEEILKISRVFVEYTPQTLIEGEIQNTGTGVITAELWELVAGIKQGRISEEDITLFDSVGFAIEDYSSLRMLYDLSREYGVGKKLTMIPQTSDPRNIFAEMMR